MIFDFRLKNGKLITLCGLNPEQNKAKLYTILDTECTDLVFDLEEDVFRLVDSIAKDIQRHQQASAVYQAHESRPKEAQAPTEGNDLTTRMQMIEIFDEAEHAEAEHPWEAQNVGWPTPRIHTKPRMSARACYLLRISTLKEIEVWYNDLKTCFGPDFSQGGTIFHEAGRYATSESSPFTVWEMALSLEVCNALLKHQRVCQAMENVLQDEKLVQMAEKLNLRASLHDHLHQFPESAMRSTLQKRA